MSDPPRKSNLPLGLHAEAASPESVLTCTIWPDKGPASSNYNTPTMGGPPKKRQRRDEKPETAMPQKKFYRQRAHANPFSDHDLE